MRADRQAEGGRQSLLTSKKGKKGIVKAEKDRQASKETEDDGCQKHTERHKTDTSK